MRKYLRKRSVEVDKQPGIQYSQAVLLPCATRACGGSCRRRPTLGPHTCCPCPVRLWVCLCQAHAAHLRDPCRTPSESRVAPVNFGEVDHTARELRQKIGPRTCRPPALVTQTDCLPAEAGWWLATRQKSAALSTPAGEQCFLPASRQRASFAGIVKNKTQVRGECVSWTSILLHIIALNLNTWLRRGHPRT